MLVVKVMFILRKFNKEKIKWNVIVTIDHKNNPTPVQVPKLISQFLIPWQALSVYLSNIMSGKIRCVFHFVL